MESITLIIASLSCYRLIVRPWTLV